MVATEKVRVRRIDAVHDSRDVDGPLDYMDAVTVGIADRDDRSPEQWFRAVFEGAPLLVRCVLIVGWRTALLLRLGPRRSPAHILGWRIRSSDDATIRLHTESVLLTALLVLRLSDNRVVVTSNVAYKTSLARPVWTMVKPIHRLMLPYLVGRAAKRVEVIRA